MAASSSTPQSSFNSSSSIPARKYDVFLSFRGEDTRTNFTDHLFNSLKREGFSVFRDDDKLQRGKDIAIELLKAIEDSRISIIIFSKDYADSRWCLDELVKIMECKNTLQQMVVPVFYGVVPSDIRKQCGSLEQVFANHEKIHPGRKVKRWRAVLTEAANLSGWELKKRHESKFIEDILADISKKLDLAYSNVGLYPVGIKPRVEDIEELLNMESDEGVRMIGIWGIGGLGKTTLAKAVYNQFHWKFEGSGFLANVREQSKQPRGLIGLQEQVICDVLKIENQMIRDVDRGIEVIKQRVQSRKIFLVVDDVDNIEQLKALAIGHEWLHMGSRVIVTTRDKSVIDWLQVDRIYEPKLLNSSESLELFSWHAFRKPHPNKEYAELSTRVVAYAKRLPLALEVFGSLLIGKNELEWKSTIDKLKVIHPDAIQEKLRVSFDSLDAREKGLFLDIACFFVGAEKTSEVMHIFDGCGYFPEIGIGNLCRRGLLRIDESNKMMMHDLIRDMGRDIVYYESPEEPGKRSRLWLEQDILDVLTNHSGTEAVEGIILNLPWPESDDDRIVINGSAFAKMTKLRLLKLNYVQFSGSYEHLSKRMIWLSWWKFPESSLPSNLCLEKLSVLDLSFSHVIQLWSGTKNLNKLKALVVRGCSKLEISDLSGLTSLEELQHGGWLWPKGNLSSIERLTSCKNLDFNSNMFMRLPFVIGHLDQLEYLDLHCCTRLVSLPELPNNLRRLDAHLCGRLETISIESNWWRRSPLFDFTNCKKLTAQVDELLSRFKKRLLKNQEQEQGSGHVQFTLLLSYEDKIPAMFCPRSGGALLSFVVPPSPRSDVGKIRGFILCILFRTRDASAVSPYDNNRRTTHFAPHLPFYRVINKTKGVDLCEQAVHHLSNYPYVLDQMWISYNLGPKYQVEMESGDEVEFSSADSVDYYIKEIGVNLIYANDSRW